MKGADGEKSMRIIVPRWAQMVLLPVLVLLVWFAVAEVNKVIFIFLAATIIALMLNPLVKHLETLKVPRPLGVLIVYSLFLALLVAFFIVVIPPAIDQLQELVDRLPFYITEAGDELARWKASFERLNLPIDVSAQSEKIISRLEDYGASLGTWLVSQSFNVITVLTQLLVVVVISIYMLLDARRIGDAFRNLFPAGSRDDADELIQSSQKALNQWVRAQVLLGFLIGLSVGVGIWLLDITGIWSGGGEYSIFFGAWAGLTEFIPYIGPILGATPPVILALFSSPWAALAVVILFIFIQQVEGHVLVPTIMGSLVGVHPLLVIFAVLAGAELYGIAGMIIALPTVALGRQLFIFFRPRVVFEKREPPLPEKEGDGEA